ncbi:amino acid deaminase/aldolase [Paenibacillus lignilyticus]|uniref:Amino acid deaminase/aldolase n=1 Tax=Paenibacillus lignilyticus TaxID=1172615 RepID=A0ABS5CHU3_9BACL|nr:amino acid deaminase/aldolase [Paenibacillus lignilyticus]MBP3965416.1 amino acid deaminase/aldolase [Paenibacillus lignilyticus]
MSDTYAYYKTVFEGVPKPFAFVDLDMLDRNIAAIANAAGSKKVRIASKSIRCLEVMRRILASSPVYQGIMCYTADEAAMLVREGFDDLLLGYPQWQPDRIAELVRSIGEGRSITFMVDCAEHVRQIERIAAEQGVVVPLCLDIDMSADYPGLHFGVWRSPLSSWEQACPVAELIAASAWLKLDGIMGYEAQVAGLGDNVAGKQLKNSVIRWLKKRSIAEVAKRRREVVEGLEAMGAAELRFVNAGGTGSMDSSRLEACVTEITAGSGFYAPGLFDAYTGFRYEPAAGFAVEIVRRPRPDIVTCMGGGYTASGAIGIEKQAQVYLPEGLELFPLEGAGEVQTPLRVKNGLSLSLGDPVFFRHAKAGELCERFLHLVAVSKGQIVGEYATYRGMGACFL